MQNAVYANGYTLKPGESLGPASEDFTLIPHIGILQAGSTDQSTIIVANLNLGYTMGAHDCTFKVQMRIKTSQQEEVVIATLVMTGVYDINTVVSLQGFYVLPRPGTDIDILFYWSIIGSTNVAFTHEQTWCGSAVLSPMTLPTT